MECSILKLIIEKGPRAGESLEYPSGSVVKIGRLVRGNTLGIKDAGISSKHISIEFDNEVSKWNLTDLDSSNGTLLNGTLLKPNVPSTLEDGDCIKIGELTSIIVKIELQSTIPPERYPRRQGKSGPPAAAVESTRSGLGLGLDGDLGENAVEEPVQKRVLRPRGKKVADTNPDFPIERKVTRGRPKKLQVQPSKDPDLDKGEPADIVVPVDGRRTRRGRKALPVEPLEDLHVLVDAASENIVQNSGVKEKLNANNESAQDDVAEKLLLTQEVCEGQEAIADQSVHVDKDTGVDTSRWEDLEKMTLGDFFDYLEWHLPKEIREKTEEIISQLPEKASLYREARVQNEKGKGKQAMD
ncbi:hypothetical protein LXL04_007324 [Taraxacum kok-saghyz]